LNSNRSRGWKSSWSARASRRPSRSADRPHARPTPAQFPRPKSQLELSWLPRSAWRGLASARFSYLMSIDVVSFNQAAIALRKAGGSGDPTPATAAALAARSAIGLSRRPLRPGPQRRAPSDPSPRDFPAPALLPPVRSKRAPPDPTRGAPDLRKDGRFRRPRPLHRP
jgi:hypothetical protein